ncbi:MAG: serine hydrolase domain-containing protein [Planctomycetota bacterium]
MKLACFCCLTVIAVHPVAAEIRPAPSIAAITNVIEEAIQRNEVSGAVTAVYHDTELKHRSAAGLANLATKRPMTTQTRFAIASMTKPIVATGLMILVDEEKVSLNDPISKYIPQFEDVKLKDGSAPLRAITILDAVTHTSGMQGEQTFDGTLTDAVLELASRPLAFNPGERWQYSPGITVIGRIIEIVSQQSLEQFLQERIFEPLTMDETSFQLEPDELAQLATIYQPGDVDGTLQRDDNWIVDPTDVRGPNPSGGLFSTVDDLLCFYRMMLNQGVSDQGDRIVSRASYQAMTSPAIGSLESGFTPGNTWGLGWCLVREPQDATAMLSEGTFGHGGAFGTQGWIDPQTRTIFVLLIQRTKFGNSDASDLRRDFQAAAVNALSKP